jgi:hypothetical protein
LKKDDGERAVSGVFVRKPSQEIRVDAARTAVKM